MFLIQLIIFLIMKSGSQSPAQQNNNSQAQTNSLTNPQIIQQPLSVGGGGGMANFFNSRGPIRPQFLVGQSNGPQQQQSSDPLRQQQQQQQRVAIPQGRDFLKNQNMLSPPSQNSSGGGGNQPKLNNNMGDEYYGEEDEYGEEEKMQSARTKHFTPEQEQEILHNLAHAGGTNREFVKVMAILQQDPELRPLIFEHEILLRCLTGMHELRAENMLSILTAAETEMYENTHQREEQGNDSSSDRRRFMQERETFQQFEQQANIEITKLHRLYEAAQEETAELQGQRAKTEKEHEVTLKNLFDEIAQLKKQNEQLRRADHESRRSLEAKDREVTDEFENLRSRLRQQEDHKIVLVGERDKVVMELKDLQERYQRDVSNLERENENLHRKLNSTFNSALLQRAVIKVGPIDEQEKELSLSFQGSRILAEDNRGDPAQPALCYGNTTQNIRLLLSGEQKSAGSNSGNNSLIVYPRGNSGLNDFSNNPFYGGNIDKNAGGQLNRTSSVEVLLLDNSENRKQSRLALHQGNESQSSGPEANKLYVQQRGFLEMKNIRNQSEEIRTSNAFQFKQLEEQLRKLQIENENLRQENKILGLNKNTNNPYIEQFGTPRIGGGDLGISERSGSHKVGSTSRAVHDQDHHLKSHHNSHGSVQLSTALLGKSSHREQPSSSHREKELEVSFIDMKNHIQDIGYQLLAVYKKLQPSVGDLSKFQLLQEFNVAVIRDLITDISVRADSIMDNSIKPSHFYNQAAALNTIGQSLSPLPQTNYSGSFFTPQQHQQPQINNFMSNTAYPHHQATPQSPFDNPSVHFNFLAEKELRLKIQEDLQNTREQVHNIIKENMYLKQELDQQARQHEYQRGDWNKPGEKRELEKVLRDAQNEMDRVLSENSDLKSEIMRLQGIIEDERHEKEIKLDVTCKGYQHEFQDHILELKQKYEEKLMYEKEANNKLRLECGRVTEDKVQMHSQFMNALTLNEKLEKENYNLKNELTQEQLKNFDLQPSKPKDAKSQERAKIATLIQRTDQRVREFQDSASHWEQRAKRAESREDLIRMQYSGDIAKIRTDNDNLISQMKVLQGIKSNVIPITQVVQATSPGAIETSLYKQYQQKLAAYRLASLIHVKDIKQMARSVIKLAIYQKAKDDKSEAEANALSMSQLEDTKTKAAMLEEQLSNQQNQNTILLSQIGKMLRYINSNRQIKLQLSGLVTSYNIDYVLTGLKNNSEIQEINLSNSGLNDADLQKICESLRNDSYVVNLKLQKNNFTSLQPVIELFKNQQTKGSHFQELDFSNTPLEFRLIDPFKSSLDCLASLQQLSLAHCFTQVSFSPQGKLYTIDKIDQLLLKLLGLPQLKALDLSKNKFYSESLATFFKNIRVKHSQGELQLRALSLSSVEGFNDENAGQFSEVCREVNVIKQINISGNKFSSPSMAQIIKSMTELGQIEEVDLSKCHFEGKFKELSEMISSNKKLRSLSIQKVGLTDSQAQVLVQPIADSINLETLKFDFNQLGSVFVERLCQRISQNPIQNQLPIRQTQINTTQSEQSFTDDSSAHIQLFPTNSTKNLHQDNGLVYISFEGNSNLGDRGAKALADVIRIPIQNTKSLTMVNLNECGITKEGFEELKSALHQRGNLAQIANLTHVKIKIERNPIGN